MPIDPNPLPTISPAPLGLYVPPGMPPPYVGDSRNDALLLTSEDVLWNEEARSLYPGINDGDGFNKRLRQLNDQQDGGVSEGPSPSPSEGTDPRREEADTRAKRAAIGDATIRQLSEGHYYTPAAEHYPNLYFLELYLDYTAKSSSPDDAVSLAHINGIKKSSPVALVRSRGMDGSVYQENEGFMQHVFTLTGRSGDTKVDLIRFQKMRNFLVKYANESKQHKNAFVRGQNVQLALYFPFEAEAYLCDVVSFDYGRSATSSTNSFEYQLVLVTNGMIGNKWALPYHADALAKLASSYDYDHRNLNHPCAKLKKAEEDERPPDDWPPLVPPDDLDPVNPTGCAVAASGERTLMKFNLLTNYLPYNEAQEALTRYFYTLSHAADMVNAGQVQSGSTFDPCGSPAYNFRTFGLRVDVPADMPRPGQAQRTVQGLPIPTEVYQCTQGKTDAFAIAEDVYGDRSEAPRIIDYNRFLDAYTLGDGSPIETGTAVYIPRATGVITTDGDAFGTDLRLDAGDLVPVGTEDIATVTGYTCYTQNLLHRMTTTVGRNKVYTKYGLKPQVGLHSTSDVPGELRADVRSQVQADHRTRRVLSIELEERGDTVSVDVVVEPIGQQPSRVAFTYNLVG